jgi:hypothetical protein
VLPSQPSPPPLRRVALPSALFAAAVLAAALLIPGGSAGARVGHAKRHQSHTKHHSGGSHAPLKMIWGPVSLPNGQSAFPTYHRLGVQVLQLDLQWAQVAPTRPGDPQDPNDPAYKWPAALDQAVQQAAQYGIKLCLQVKYTPPWANGNRSTTWGPTNTADYADFVTAAARRYP